MRSKASYRVSYLFSVNRGLDDFNLNGKTLLKLESLRPALMKMYNSDQDKSIEMGSLVTEALSQIKPLGKISEEEVEAYTAALVFGDVE